MTIRLLNENVLEVEADALLLPIDGQAPGLGGTVARAFSREWPHAYRLLESRIAFPVALGRAICVRGDTDCPWGAVIFITTLNHLRLLSEDEKGGVMASAFFEALSICVSYRLDSISTVILKGGWRLPTNVAIAKMASVYRASEYGRQRRTLNICCLDPRECESATIALNMKNHQLVRVGR